MSDLKNQKSRYISFLDESGDHSLDNTDPDFPIFVLSLVLISRKDYEKNVITAVNRLKLRFWDHEGINFHSRDIRKRQGAFSELIARNNYRDFVSELSQCMEDMPYTLFVSVIRKDMLSQKYKYAENPYDLSLKFLLERVLDFVKAKGIKELPIIAEARGKNEDNQLKAEFFDLLGRGTGFVKKEEFQKCNFQLEFQKKSNNLAGIQVADLCAYPCARYVIDRSKPNPAFDVVRKHIYRPHCGLGVGFGWKIFP
ncbi:hypothetical protein Pla110_09050 [Polystyrenella longa]|uniref:DUF3800 domain-containing protein n=1 Tax=Polystyrenella longa TaxID=2528007 RepID=A0A518CJ10_9PLAN|nr:DUF3800 domain-containing protein [Polystyrenella longa]QDU79200.1 hypothetical protein Pla110_09050 [Polystyrenella longa]